MNAKILHRDLVLALVVMVAGMVIALDAEAASTDINYKNVEVNGLDVFYREAGDIYDPPV